MANVDNYIILCFIVATAILLAIQFPISIKKNTVVRKREVKSNDLFLVQLKV